MRNKNEVFEYLIDQLRQQVNGKDVTSFNVSVQISDLDEVKQVIHNLQQHIAGKDDEIRALKDSLRQQVTNNQCEDLAHEVQSLKNQLRDMSELVDALLGTITLMNGKSSCRKEDAQECYHNWRFVGGKSPAVCINCGVTKAEECKHDWVLDEKGDYFVCYKCGRQEAELDACQHTNIVGLRKGFAPGFTKKCLDCGAKLK